MIYFFFAYAEGSYIIPIIHSHTSQTSQISFKISTLCSSLLFSQSKVLLCYQISSTSFFKKLNILNFTISITWYILLSFFFNFYWFMLKDLSYSNSSKLLIWFKIFSAAFSTRSYNRSTSPSFFFYHFFSLSNLTFLWPDLVFFISFEFIFLISCFDYLHLIATYFLNHSFSYPFQYSHKKQKDSLKTPAVLLTFSLELEISWVIHKRRIHQNSEKWWLFWGIA